jgi:GNAT superfamily N-acetyltransferase
MTPGDQPEIEIRELSAAELDLIRPLWDDLYVHQVSHGMKVSVPKDGFTLWAKGLGPLLGRYARVWGAWAGTEPQGFLCARLRNQPPHFSGESTGFISEVYVGDRLRSRGVGRRLLQASLAWFDGLDLARVELQVIAGNPKARELYVQLGWEDELLQMVRLRRPPAGPPPA